MSFDYSKPSGLLLQIRTTLGLRAQAVADEVGVQKMSISSYEGAGQKVMRPSKEIFARLRQLYHDKLDAYIQEMEKRIQRARLLKAGLDLVDLNLLRSKTEEKDS